MDEEFIVGLFMGGFFALPFGYFLRAAAQWRRDARRAAAPAAPPPVAPAQPSPEARLEKVLDRLSQRLESMEERVEFTERLLDARSARAIQSSRENATR